MTGSITCRRPRSVGVWSFLYRPSSIEFVLKFEGGRLSSVLLQQELDGLVTYRKRQVQGHLCRSDGRRV